MINVSKSQSGFALVIVIWILTLLSWMAGSFVMSMRRDSGVSLALKKNAEALALTESALNLAVFNMQNPHQEQRWLIDGTIYQILRADGSQIRIKVVSENGKIDLNAANEKLLSAVIKTVTADRWAEQKLLNSILDWRDADDEPRAQGAERKQYMEAGLPYAPSNNAFQSLDDLQMVLGMEPEIFFRIKPLLTVYSGLSDVNINEAPPEVRDILGNQAALDDMQNPQSPQSQQSQQVPQPAGANGTNNNNSTSNNLNSAYTIMVEVVLEDNASASLETVIKLSGQQNPLQSDPTPGSTWQVLDWRQNQLAPSLFAYGMESQLITIQDEFTIRN